LRFSRSLNTFKEHLETVGLLHSVRIECRSYLPDWQTGRPYSETFRARPVEGGVLLDLIHEIDYAGWIFQWPASIQARVKNLGRLGIDADEIADLAWETVSGCSVSVGLDFLSRPPRRGIIASGRNGSIQWDGLTGKVLVQLGGAPEREIVTKQSVDEMFSAQMEAFVATITDRPGKAPASLEDGVNALAVCDAARLASDARRKEPVEYPWPVAALS
jgi:predicted dehydrogenase